jgi:hypothetical protein
LQCLQNRSFLCAGSQNPWDIATFRSELMIHSFVFCFWHFSKWNVCVSETDVMKNRNSRPPTLSTSYTGEVRSSIRITPCSSSVVAVNVHRQFLFRHCLDYNTVMNKAINTEMYLLHRAYNVNKGLIFSRCVPKMQKMNLLYLFFGILLKRLEVFRLFDKWPIYEYHISGCPPVTLYSNVLWPSLEHARPPIHTATLHWTRGLKLRLTIDMHTCSEINQPLLMQSVISYWIQQLDGCADYLYANLSFTNAQHVLGWPSEATAYKCRQYCPPERRTDSTLKLWRHAQCCPNTLKIFPLM